MFSFDTLKWSLTLVAVHQHLIRLDVISGGQQIMFQSQQAFVELLFATFCHFPKKGHIMKVSPMYLAYTSFWRRPPLEP